MFLGKQLQYYQSSNNSTSKCSSVKFPANSNSLALSLPYKHNIFHLTWSTMTMFCSTPWATMLILDFPPFLRSQYSLLGRWLGNPANFKYSEKRTHLEVEQGLSVWPCTIFFKAHLIWPNDWTQTFSIGSTARNMSLFVISTRIPRTNSQNKHVVHKVKQYNFQPWPCTRFTKT